MSAILCLLRKAKAYNQKSRREEERENMEILIISGLSGGGKSRAASFLEDMGFYIVDNMPAGMILKSLHRDRYRHLSL